MKQLNAYFLRTGLFLIGSFLFFSQHAEAQTPSDAILMEKGQLCIDLSYNHDSWDEYWEGTKKRSNDNIGTLTHHMFSPMFTLGITNRINLMGGVNYVIAHPSAGQISGTHGLQNLMLDVKVDAFEADLGPGKLKLLATVGFMTPVGNYDPDYAYSIGLGCTEGSLRPIVHYQFNNGLYARVQGAYNLRGNCTIPRDYYYTTQAYASDIVDMPNAIDYSGTIGYETKNHQLRAEVIYDGFNTLGGFDIRIQDMGFPSNKMIFTRVGANIHYYPSFIKGFGIHVNGGQVLTGRNVGQSSIIGGGINYFFQLWKKSKASSTPSN